MPDVPPPPEFETAIRGLTNDLLRQMENHQRKTLQDKKLSEAELPKINIVLRPFTEADTGYTVTLSKDEEDATAKKNIKAIGKDSKELILSEVAERTTCQNELCPKEGCQKEVIVFSPDLGQCPRDSKAVKRFEKISISPLSQESLKQADYMMYGVFRLEPSPFSQSTKEIEKRYRAYAILVDEKMRPKKVIARSDTWIADKVMMAIPSRESSGSPIYLKDTGLEELLRQVINTRTGDSVTTGISSEVDAIIADASTAFGKGEMDNALALYKKAEQLPGGKQLKVYSSLYQIYYQKGSLPEAKEVLAQMVALGVANKELSFKFLFKVNSVEFGAAKANMSETEETLNWIKQYPFWLEEIGTYFEKSKECFEIIGHASRTGSVEYNRELSLRRANRIKTLITEKFKSVNTKVNSVQGKGHDDCTLLPEPKGICTGTDNEQDAYDRRVEFKVNDCPQVPTPKSK
jgi:outer membrane protein OmpA-like peptidoglycan-associated protein